MNDFPFGLLIPAASIMWILAGECLYVWWKGGKVEFPKNTARKGGGS